MDSRKTSSSPIRGVFRKRFDRSALEIQSLAMRRHNLDISIVKELNSFIPLDGARLEGICEVAKRIVRARKNCASTIMMMGAHVVRSGVQRYIIDLMKRGYVSCIAMNGACAIHDFELAMIGGTTENVAHYIKKGQFGLWKETGVLNDIINEAYRKDDAIGMGEAIGEAIATGDFPHKGVSIVAAAYGLRVPITIHVGIGYDIIHELPNCDGAATGALSYNDFLKFASIVRNLENGVVMNFGSAVMAPEVFLKALSMARNIARQERNAIRKFTTLVCDLYPLPHDYSIEAPRGTPGYYFRPWKTMLVRTIADGGEGYYVMGDHGETIPALWTAVGKAEEGFNADGVQYCGGEH